MDLSEPPKRPRGESIVPMINVVFLLLIFFLMTSQLAQPDPFDVTPPHARSDAEVEAEPVLFVDDAGRLSFAGAKGRQAIEAITAIGNETAVIQLRADADLEAAKLAAILRQLSEAGLARVELVVARK